MKRLILPIACGICTVTSDAQTDKQPHPNVIFIYADDLGYTDLSCTGSRFYETPHIDKLAREGVCFYSILCRMSGFVAVPGCSVDR